MTMFAPHRDTLERFVDCMHAGADENTLTRLLAADVVLYGPFGDEPITGMPPSGTAHRWGWRRVH
ncbi:hypothetical protein BST36_11160 [Mycolicibacterium moriokaense]|uniref:SnoaL-like domain-containing protein n=1 Tax=Mycolicibacterium moriokaense TaxID=39691 RepID=A0AAD1HBZ8_9MYCO|nr:hypothetical protein [Mycolicibacterium moriokaense]MCV7038319.1 hypothetical protein [Mycolicibacterium moriokaense]ORB24294.1 hypothetical protein BST36_11160 [Mycolicibacterium moriokaense]BBX02560.1 hypothetical protein MMOR_34960 [Mycolicibacterium moriokaense]